MHLVHQDLQVHLLIRFEWWLFPDFRHQVDAISSQGDFLGFPGWLDHLDPRLCVTATDSDVLGANPVNHALPVPYPCLLRQWQAQALFGDECATLDAAPDQVHFRRSYEARNEQ